MLIERPGFIEPTLDSQANIDQRMALLAWLLIIAWFPCTVYRAKYYEVKKQQYTNNWPISHFSGSMSVPHQLLDQYNISKAAIFITVLLD